MLNLARYLMPIAEMPRAWFFFDVALKATVLLGLATMATALSRRSSAAVRHRVWRLTFAALLLLPALSAALPRWQLAVLPSTNPLAGQEEDNSPFAGREQSRPLAGQALANRPAAPSEFNERASVEERVRLPLAEREDYSALSPHADEPPAPPTVPAVWFAGALAALLPLIVSWLRIQRFFRKGRVIDDADWRDLLNQLRRRLGLVQRVALRETDAPLMPMAWGVLRPAILLPREARDWPDRLRRIVLLHELAHIKRHDVSFQLLGRVACAVYWFHPLAWYGLRRLRIERELACDDCVVHAGERASDYAAELLLVARSYRRVAPAAAVAMAQRNQLEHRLRALFDRAGSHLPVSPRAARLLLGGVLMFVTAIAAVRLAPRAADADDAAQPSSTAAADAPTDDLITVSGTVVDPRGKPLAGAKLYAVRWYWEPHGPRPPLAETSSNARGRFTISYRKFAADIGREDPWKEVAIVATADGFGAAWAAWRELPRGKEATLRLSEDVPIVGRVVDLEGNPVAGVNVRVGNILSSKNGSLDGWLAAVQRGEIASTAAQHFGEELPRFDGWPPPAATGKDGRFRLNGIGRERKIQLSFSSPKIAYQEIEVVTRRSDVFPLKLGDEARGWGLAALIYGPELELVVPPTQPITGIVRDATTRQPLAGVSIESNIFAGNNSIHLRQLKAVSDAEGRYRLVGMPKRAGNHVLAVPNDDQPYLMLDVEVPESSGLEPIQLDIDLHRGVWITGRVTDLRSGAGVVAQLHYHPFLSNRYAQQTPEFGKPRTPDGFDTRYMSRPDGGYRLVGLPGRAIVGAECVIGRYRQGVGADKIAGMNEYGDFDTYPNPIFPGKKWPNAIKEINPPPDAETVRCDLVLDPGEKVTIDVIDREGKSVAGFEAEGAVQAGYDTHDLNGRLDVVTLAPDETRTLIIRHNDRKLGKVVRVKVGDHPTGSFTVVLESLGKIVGRLIDRQGAPIGGAAITALVTPRPLHGFQDRLPPAATDADGHFEYTDLPSGCTYELDAQAAGLKQASWLAKDIAVDAGQTKDLGDVVYGAALKPTAKKPATAQPEQAADVAQPPPAVAAKSKERATGDKMKEQRTLTIRGRVLLPDGKPAVGADLYWARIASTEPRSAMMIEKRGVTDAEGRCQFALTSTDLPPAWAPISLVARKAGFGLAWQEIVRDDIPDAVTLQLVEDLPIRGHIIDTEGRPVAGARVSVGSLLASRDGNLDAFLLAWQHDWRFAWAKLDRAGALYAPLDGVLGATTDQDGRFELTGVGAGRVAAVEIKAAGYAFDELQVVTQKGFDPQPYNNAARSLLPAPPAPVRGMIATLAGPEFEHVATAELIVRGKVFTDNRKPVAGARVYLSGGGYAPGVSALTDAEGRYELHGQPRGVSVLLDAGAPESAGLLRKFLQCPTTTTQTVLPIDITLKRGVVLKGRVFDRSTGKGVQASLRFVPLADNTFVDEDGHTDPAIGTNDAGEYRLLAMPGPGVLTCQTHDGPRLEGRQINPYRQASFSKEDSRRVPTIVDGDDRYFTSHGNAREFLMSENAVKVVDLKPDGAPATCDLAVDPGKKVNILIEDGEGQPVTGAIVSGMEDSDGAFKVAAPNCTIYGLGADRPRRVCILHPERRLAAAITLTGDEAGPVKVRLAASARISGRAFAPDGQPLADALVQINYARRNANALDRSLNSERAAHKTDLDGRCHVDNIVPGERFSLDFKLDGTFYRAPVIPFIWDRRVLDAGQKLELGDVRVK